MDLWKRRLEDARVSLVLMLIILSSSEVADRPQITEKTQKSSCMNSTRVQAGTRASFLGSNRHNKDSGVQF